jgi:quinol monooxygenase YgiN
MNTTLRGSTPRKYCEVSWQVRLAIKPNQLPNFHRLTGEMVKSARAELGVRSYQRFLSADGGSIHIYERYSDSSTALVHLQSFRVQFADRFGAMVERKEFFVYGHPSDELKRVLDSYGAQYLEPFGDFGYWA